MKQKTRFKNFGNIDYRLSVHEWPMYRYRPQKSHISRFLVFIKTCQVMKSYIDGTCCWYKSSCIHWQLLLTVKLPTFFYFSGRHTVSSDKTWWCDVCFHQLLKSVYGCDNQQKLKCYDDHYLYAQSMPGKYMTVCGAVCDEDQ